VLLAAGVATAAVGLGLLLGLGSAGGSALVGPLRTFAFTAALGVAVTHLLPEALGELGAPGLLLFAAASVAPAWGVLVRRLAGAPTSHAHDHAVLGAGYAGLLVHHVGDGLGLGAYSGLPGGPLAHADVLVALAVHTVPLVAVVTLAFRSQRGVRAAVERALGLAAASVGGVLLSGSVPERFTQSLSAWIAAGVAGLLLHVVTHDLGRDLPATAVARGVDWLAAALGILTSALGADTDLEALRRTMLDAFDTGAARAAPAIAFGLAITVYVARATPKSPTSRLESLPPPARTFDGALLATTLASARFGILFWLGTALTTKLSSLFSGHRLEHAHSHGAHSHGAHSHGAHSHAHSANSHDARTTRNSAQIDVALAPHGTPQNHTAPAAHLAAPLSPLLREYSAWTLTGLVLYALLTAALPPDALGVLTLPVALAGAAFCSFPIELPPITAIFVAAAAWQRGLRSEAALTFALLAVASTPTRRSVLPLLLGVVIVALANHGAPFAPVSISLPLAVALLALPALATLFVAWQHGIRGLFASVFHSHDSV
jgi:hypothetical protein